MQELEKKYFQILFLTNFSRTIPHAVLTIILLTIKEIPIEGIALTQISFFIAIMIFEIPSGILSDEKQRKILFIGSLFLLSLSNAIIYFGDLLFVLCIGWFFYGISSALSSGNIEGYIIKKYKENDEMSKIKKFNVCLNYVNFISAGLGAIVGSVLYQWIGINIYMISCVIYIYCIFVVSFKFDFGEEKIIDFKKIKSCFKFSDNFNTVKIFFFHSSRSTLVKIGIVSSFALFYQPFYQYWQILYYQKGILVAFFGLIYAFNICVSLLSNAIYSKYTFGSKGIYSITFLYIISILLAIQYLNGIYFFIMMTISLFSVNILNIVYNVSLLEVAKEESISTMMSLSSTISRGIGITTLLLISILLKYFNMNYIVIIFIVFGIILIYGVNQIINNLK